MQYKLLVIIISIVASFQVNAKSCTDSLSVKSEPSEVIKAISCVEKLKIDKKDKGLVSSILPIGSIIPFPGSQIPNGWMLCDGRRLEFNSNEKLYNVIGTNWGGREK